MATPFSDRLATTLAPDAAPQPAGIRRRDVVGYTIESPDYAKEFEAKMLRDKASYGSNIVGFAKQIAGNQEGAMESYARADELDAQADAVDSDVSTNWRDIDSAGALGGFARKLAIGSSTEMAASLGLGGLARGAARRTVGQMERSAVAKRVTADLGEYGAQAPLARAAVARQGARTVGAADARTAEKQFGEAISDVSAAAVARSPAAQARIDRAGRAAGFAGAAAGQFPSLVSGSRDELQATDQEGALKIGAANLGASALGAIPVDRALGRIFNNPAIQQSARKNIREFLPGVAKEMGKQGFAEGSIEVAQAVAQRAGHKWVNDNVQMLSPEAIDDYVANFIGGAVLGSALGGSVDASARAAGVTVEAIGTATKAGRWAWDASGGTRAKVRENLAAVSDKVQSYRDRRGGADDSDAAYTRSAKRPRRGEPMGEPSAAGSAADMFRRAQDAMTGAATTVGGAAKKFRDTYFSQRDDDGLDASADEVMDQLDAMRSNADEGAPFGDSVVARADTLSQKWMLSKLSPEFLAAVPEGDALRLGRILEKFATGKDLGPTEVRTLNRVAGNPASGLNQSVLNLFGGTVPLLAALDVKMSASMGAEADAPQLSQSRLGAEAELAATARVAKGVTSAEGDGIGGVSDEEVAAIEAGEDPSGIDVKDFNSGFSERTGPEGRPAPVDRMNSIRTDMRRMSGTLGKDAARATPEYKALQEEGLGLRAGLLSGLNKSKAIITRNDATTDSIKLWADRKAAPDTVRLIDPAYVTLRDGVTVIQQPQLLDLGTLIFRQMEAIRAEGTTEGDISPEAALLRGLTEASEAGLRVDFKSLKPGAIINKKNDTLLLNVTPKLIAQLQPAESKERTARKQGPRKKPVKDREQARALFFEGAADPDAYEAVLADIKTLEARELDLSPGLADMLQRLRAAAARNKPTKQGVDAVDWGDFDVGSGKQFARNTPAGVQVQTGTRAGEFVPQEGVVSDVSASNPHGKLLSKLRSQLSGYVNEAGKTVGRIDAPRARAALIRKAGVTIGKAQLAAELEADQINQVRYDAETKRLLDPASGLAKRYVVRAGRGDFDSVSVRHSKTNSDAPAKEAVKRDGAEKGMERPWKVAKRLGQRSANPKWNRKPSEHKPEKKEGKVGSPLYGRIAFTIDSKAAKKKAVEAPVAPKTTAQGSGRSTADADLDGKMNLGFAKPDGMSAARAVVRALAELKAATAARAARKTESQAEDDGSAAGTATPKATREENRALTDVANSMLALLGIDIKLNVKRTTSTTGGLYTPGKQTVLLGESLKPGETIEVLGHEVGHHVVLAHLFDLAKNSAMYKGKSFKNFSNLMLRDIGGGRAEWEVALKALDPKLYAALIGDYNTWRAQQTPDTLFTAMRASRSGIARSQSIGAKPAFQGKTLADTPDLELEYQLSMSEWLADNVMRALLQKKAVTDVMGPVEAFFAGIAAKLRDAYDSMVGADFKPAPSVEAWVNGMFDRNAADVKAATGVSTTPAKAASAVEAAVRSENVDQATNAALEAEEVAAAKAAAASANADIPKPPGTKPGKGAPKGPKPPQDFDAMVQWVRDFLPPQARQILEEMFSRDVIVQRLRKHYARRQDVLDMIDSAEFGMEGRIAAGYLAWRKGAFNTGPKGASALTDVKDSLLKLFNIASTGAYAARIMDDMAKGRVERFMRAGKPYDAVLREQYNRGTAQAVANKVAAAYEKAADILGIAFTSKMKRMAESGVPAMRRIAAKLYRPGGTTGDDVGYNRAVVHATALMMDKASSIVEGLDKAGQLRVLKLLQRQTTEADLMAKVTDSKSTRYGKFRYGPATRKAVKDMRALMDEAYTYAQKAGVNFGYRKDFFAVQLDINNDSARTDLSALLGRPYYEAAIRELYGKENKKTGKKEPSKKPMAELIKDLVDGAAGMPTAATTGAGAPNFRSMNFRSMEFVYRLGTPADIKAFAALQTNDMAGALGGYLQPMIKRAEYARRFGDGGAGLQGMLDDMKTQGATEQQLKEALQAVEAAIGTYGADRSPTVAAISPALADKFSGPKTRRAVQNIQAYQNARLLPLALLASLVDPMGIAVRTGGDFSTAWKGFKLGLRSLTNKSTRAEIHEMLRMVGATTEFATLDALNQGFGGGGNISPFATKVNEFVFKWNGLAGWTRTTRYMAVVAAHSFMVKHGAFDSDTSRRYMAELGLKRGDILGGEASSDGHLLVKLLEPAQRAALEKKDTDAARNELAADERVKTALMQFVDEAILRPNSQQTPQWHSDPYMGIVTQYKAFGYAMYDQIVGRIMREAQHGNSKVWLAALMYAPLVLTAEMMRNVVQGDGEENDDWSPGEWMAFTLERTGLHNPALGVAVDTYDDVQQGRLPGASQAGPTLGQVRNVSGAFQGRRDLSREFESAVPTSAIWRKWNDENIVAAPPPI